MRKQKMILKDFVEMLFHKVRTGKIDGKILMDCVRHNLLPRQIKDTRGKLCLAIKKSDDGDIEVTHFFSDNAREVYMRDAS